MDGFQHVNFEGDTNIQAIATQFCSHLKAQLEKYQLPSLLTDILLTRLLEGFSVLRLIALKASVPPRLLARGHLQLLALCVLQQVSKAPNKAAYFIRTCKPRRAREKECKLDRSQSLLQSNLRRGIQSLLPCILFTRDLNDPDNHDGVITHLGPDILQCEVKWSLGSITTNKVSGGDGIPIELFKTLKNDAGKVLHSLCQQIWKTQQWW